MAPRKQVTLQEPDHVSEEDSTQGDSPSQVYTDAINVMDECRSKREQKRKAIENEYKNRCKDIGRRMDELFKVKDARVTKTQKDAWNRLDALNKRREAVEQVIIASMKQVESHTLSISKELEATFKGRIEELDELSSQPAMDSA